MKTKLAPLDVCQLVLGSVVAGHIALFAVSILAQKPIVPLRYFVYSGVFVFMIAAGVAANAEALGRLCAQVAAAIGLTQVPALSMVLTADGAPSLFLLHFVPPIGSLYPLWLVVAMRRHLDLQYSKDAAP